MNSLNNKKVLVTGASRGIGKAIALSFGGEGADVAVNCSKSEDEAKRVVKELRALGSEPILVKADVAVENQVRDMVKKVSEKYGRINILVNCAGVVVEKPIEDQSEKDWDEVMDTNLKGPFLCSKYVGKEMMKDQSGVIINVASISGIIPEIGTGAYTPSKAGLIGLTRLLAMEWAKYGIRVNAISPGPIKTKLQDRLYKEELIKLRAEAVPMKRYGKPKEIADAAVFLASDKAAYVTGETLTVDGGSTHSMFNLVHLMREGRNDPSS